MHNYIRASVGGLEIKVNNKHKFNKFLQIKMY